MPPKKLLLFAPNSSDVNGWPIKRRFDSVWHGSPTRGEHAMRYYIHKSHLDSENLAGFLRLILAQFPQEE